MAADPTGTERPAAAAPMPVPSPVPGPVLVFERRGETYCCPVADVAEIVEEPALDDPGYPAPLLAGVLLHEGILIPAVDPACVFDRPPERRGDAILIRGAAGTTVGLLADRVLGFRTPSALAPTPWIPAGRLCRAAAVIDGIGRAFLFGADGLGDVPAVPQATRKAAGPLAVAENSPAAGVIHLVFTIAGRAFAASFADVRRILHRQRLFRVPGAVAPLHYAVEVIGAVVPVLDITEPERMPETGEFVVLNASVGPLALRVDRIERPLPLVHDAAEPGWFPTPGVTGIARYEERAYSLVSGEALLQDLVGTAAADATEVASR